ncbi:MAG: repressor LexA [Legionellales bacterium]|nr:repressor LexA [Legionellales bacterium]|tara:strand:+ start:1967 stop:2566 length:600 start_codon:yes stop_codon:yes gene_type:complete
MLTVKQKEAYQFIKDYINEHDYSPTVMELAEAINISSRGVAYRYLKALEQANLVVLIPNKRRNIQLIKPPKDQLSIPLLGRIAAGQPIEAISQNEAIRISDIFVGADRYALQVVGSSMIEEGIFDGDIVICQHSDQARNGQIVVAVVDQENATLKRIHYHHNDTITLMPANSQYKPQVYESSRVIVQGVFIGLLRICDD